MYITYKSTLLDHCEIQTSTSVHAENSGHVSPKASFWKIYYGSLGLHR